MDKTKEMIYKGIKQMDPDMRPFLNRINQLRYRDLYNGTSTSNALATTQNFI